MQSPAARSQDAERYRVTLQTSSVAKVEDSGLPSGWMIPPLCEPSHQLIFTYEGLFGCSVGQERWLIDSSQILFVSPGREYAVHHPLRCTGDAALIVTPSPQLLAEVESVSGVKVGKAFRSSTGRSTMRLRLMIQNLLRFSPSSGDPLKFDEWVVRTVHEALQAPPRTRKPAGRSVVRTAKEILHARIGERVSLGDVANEVGVTPIYLTQEFTRSEGVPLCRYARRLRLSRALAELPHCNDITDLALDLGFSSHSHFSESFRKAFGMAPSEYRATVGSTQLRVTEASVG